jgi:hypothetical protein
MLKATAVLGVLLSVALAACGEHGSGDAATDAPAAQVATSADGDVIAGVDDQEPTPLAPPTTEADVADEIELSNVATMVFSLPGQLEERYPEAYGGIYGPEGANDRWIIRIVEGAPGSVELVEQVQSVMAEALDRTGRTMSVEFEPTTLTRARINVVRQEIADQMVSGGAWAQLGVIGVGLDLQGVHVMVLPRGDRDSVEARLAEMYPDVPFGVETSEAPTAMPGAIPGSR